MIYKWAIKIVHGKPKYNIPSPNKLKMNIIYNNYIGYINIDAT